SCTARWLRNTCSIKEIIRETVNCKYAMEFDPNNPVIQRCMQGKNLEEKDQSEEAGPIYLQAWNEAANDFEKFIAAYFMAVHQKNAENKLEWLHTALQHGYIVGNPTVTSALPSLYLTMAQCYNALGDFEN